MRKETSANANKIVKKELARRLRSADPGWRLFIRMQRGLTLGMQVTT